MDAEMDGKTDGKACPLDGAEMRPRNRGGVTIEQCVECKSVFLDRRALGLLIEQENEWHLSSGPRTQPIPRIVPGMTAPPPGSMPKQARSFIDELFG